MEREDPLNPPKGGRVNGERMSGERLAKTISDYSDYSDYSDNHPLTRSPLTVNR